MATYQVTTESGAVYEVETADPSTDQPKTFSQKSAEAIRGGAEAMLKAPGTLTAPLEEKGRQVKSAVQESIGNVMRTPGGPSPEANAALGSVLSAATEIAPFTPSEFAIAAGSELLPVAAAGTGDRMTKVGRAVANKFLGTKGKNLEKSIQAGSETLGDRAMKTPQFEGSREQVFNKSSYEVERLENQIQKVLNKTNATVSRDEVANSLDEIIAQYSGTNTDRAAIVRLQRLKNDFLANKPDQIPVQALNQYKRQLYKEIGPAGYAKDISLNPAVKQGKEVLASAIKNAIEKAVPQIGELNGQQGLMIQMRDSLAPLVADTSRSITKALTGDLIEKGYSAGAKILKGTGETLKKVPDAKGVAMASGSAATNRKRYDEEKAKRKKN